MPAPQADTTLPPQKVGFACAVTPTVTTTANGSANALTVAAILERAGVAEGVGPRLLQQGALDPA